MSDSVDFNALKSEAEELLGKLGNIQSEEAQALSERVNGALSSAKTALSAAGESTADALKNMLVSADDYVHENPWVAVGVVAGIAGAVGFLAGVAAAPKSRFWG
jgi:ElaB/YqjD/DUF883 family membrane-anchored ribosome-binding protein